MPLKATIDHTLLSLQEAVYWIIYDNFTGPSPELVDHFKTQPSQYLRSNQWGVVKCRSAQHMHEASGWEALLTALRDGDLLARGRFSNTPVSPMVRNKWGDVTFAGDPSQGWKLHSGRPTPISPEFWLSGEFDEESQSVSNAEGEYIDIVVPKFFVVAVWSEEKEVSLHTPRTLEDMAALTPYLGVLKKAIQHFWKEGNAPTVMKKDMVDWLKSQKLGNKEPLSEHLAQAMATLLRPLEGQIGGNQKWNSPRETKEGKVKPFNPLDQQRASRA